MTQPPLSPPSQPTFVWLEPRLPNDERALVETARAHALSSLHAALGTPALPEPARAAAGVRSPRLAQAMCDGLSTLIAAA